MHSPGPLTATPGSLLSQRSRLRGGVLGCWESLRAAYHHVTASLAGTSRVPIFFAVGARSTVGSRFRTDDPCWFDLRQGCFLVADSLAPERSGHVVSRFVAQSLAQELIRRLEVSAHREPLRDAMLAAFQQTHQQVLAWRRDGGPRGIEGATAVVTVVKEAEAWVAHLGDSRAYLWRSGELRQLTRDHTSVQARLEAGTITAEAARELSRRDTLLRWVGDESHGQPPELTTVSVVPGDSLLLCTDGLTRHVSPEQIAHCLQEASHPQQAADQLVRAALDAGSTASITCLVAEIRSRAPLQAASDAAVPAFCQPT